MKKLTSNWKTIKIKNLVKADWNYKKEDSERSKKLVKNLERNGQIVNLCVRKLKTGLWEVVDGNHRLDALVSVGMDSAICYDFGVISQTDAMRIAIEVNETRYESDVLKLASIFDDLKVEYSQEELLETIPFSAEDFEHFAALQEFNWEDPILDNSGVDPKKDGRKYFHTTDGEYEAIKDIIEKVRGIDGNSDWTDGRCLEFVCVTWKRISYDV